MVLPSPQIEWRRQSLSARIDELLAQRDEPSSAASPEWFCAELRDVLECSAALLLDVAETNGLSTRSAQASLALRDVVSTHLLAADDIIDVTEDDPHATGLLLRAATILQTELADVRSLAGR